MHWLLHKKGRYYLSLALATLATFHGLSGKSKTIQAQNSSHSASEWVQEQSQKEGAIKSFAEQMDDSIAHGDYMKAAIIGDNMVAVLDFVGVGSLLREETEKTRPKLVLLQEIMDRSRELRSHMGNGRILEPELKRLNNGRSGLVPVLREYVAASASDADAVRKEREAAVRKELSLSLAKLTAAVENTPEELRPVIQRAVDSFINEYNGLKS